jgi:hypothetical protein
MKRSVCFILLLIGISVMCFAKPAVQGLYFSQSLSGQYNPLGAQSDSRLYYRLPLYNSSDMLFESSKLDAGVLNWLTPLDETIGAYINIEPIAFFDLTLMAGYQYTFNIFGFGFWPATNTGMDYSPDAESKMKAENKSGMWLVATPTLKAELFKVVFVNSFTINYLQKFDYTGYYIEAHADAIMKESDTDLINETFLLYRINDVWLAGLDHYYLYVPSTKYGSQRLSAMAIFNPKIDGLFDFYAVGMAGSFIEDHFYKGMLYIAVQAGITLKF